MLKGKIDKHGYLWIERKGWMLPMQCRPAGTASIDGGFYGCGHVCPHFGEPTVEQVVDFENGKWIKDGTTFCKLKLCHGKILSFLEFTDERGEK